MSFVGVTVKASPYCCLSKMEQIWLAMPKHAPCEGFGALRAN